MSLITITKASKRLGITPQTLRNWIENGTLMGKVVSVNNSIGRRFLIDERVVEDFLGGTKGEHASVNELMAMDTQKSNSSLESRFDGVVNKIGTLEIAVMEQFNRDKKSNPEKWINAIIRDQNSLNDKINDRFSVVEEQLQSIAKTLTKITPQTTPTPESVQRAKQTPVNDPYKKWGGR